MAYIFDIGPDSPKREPTPEVEEEEVDNWAPGEAGLRRSEIPIEPSKFRILLRNEEQVVNKIKDGSGCMYVDLNEKLTQIEIMGERKQVKLAEALFAEILESVVKEKTHDTSPSEIPTIDKISVPIPRSVFGMLIGTKGRTIRNIRETSGAEVLLDELKAVVRIAGDPNQIKCAEEMVNDIIALGQDYEQAGLEKRSIPIDRSRFAILIGSRGATINRIRDCSGAEVMLDEFKGMVRISGGLEQVKLAEKLVSETLERYTYAGGRYKQEQDRSQSQN